MAVPPEAQMAAVKMIIAPRQGRFAWGWLAVVVVICTLQIAQILDLMYTLWPGLEPILRLDRADSWTHSWSLLGKEAFWPTLLMDICRWKWLMWVNVLATFTAGAAMANLRSRVWWVFALCGGVLAVGIGLFIAVEIARYVGMPHRYIWNLRQLIGW